MTSSERLNLACRFAALILSAVLVACAEPEQPTVNLYRAIHVGDLDQIKRHIYWGTDLNRPGPNGDFPLHVAARNARVVIARELLANGANVDVRNDEGRTPLQVALIEGKTQVAQELLHHGAAGNPQSLLLLFAREGVTDRDSLEFVVQRGADVNAADDTGSAALHIAVERDNMLLVKRLVDLGADVNIVDDQGRTPLATAEAKGNRDITALLISYGAAPSPVEAQE